MFVLTGPLITPLKDTPCLPIISNGSLKFRGTKALAVAPESSKLFMSPENASVTSKDVTLKTKIVVNALWCLKPGTHLAILYADRRDRRKSPGVAGAAIAIFEDLRDQRIKSPIFGISDIGD